jgi:multicomponent Na+:H+ antiporter subunit D
MMRNHAPVLIPIIFLAASVLIPLIGIRWSRGAYPLALLAAGAALFVAGSNLLLVVEQGTLRYELGGWAPPIGIEYVLDPLSGFTSLVVAVVAFLTLIHSRRPVDLELPGRQVPYYSILMLLLCGFTGIIHTGDLFNLYVFLEISALAGYGLIGVGEKKAPVAAFRYLILGTLGASFYLLGLAFLYLVGGSLNMADLGGIVPHVFQNPAFFAAAILMILGMGIKMAIFPLHGWLPDSYTHAPSTGTAILAPIGTKVAAYTIIRLLFFVFGFQYVVREVPIASVVAWLSAAGIIYGSILAMAQTDLKRMLAYSSVAQIGYIGLGIGLASPLGLIGALLHVLNHALMKACLFLVAANLRTQAGHSEIPRLDDSYRKAMPWTMAAFTLAAVSMIGLPPTAGFFSKWYLVLATIEASNWIFLAVILVSSLLNAVYFFNVLERVYLRSPSVADAGAETGASTPPETGSRVAEAPALQLAPTLVLAGSLLVVGLLNAGIVKQVLQRAIPWGL